MHQPLERLFGPLAAVDARGAEEHDSVLDVLRLEAAERFQILGQNSQRAGFVAFEELGIQIRKRLHSVIIEGQYGNRQARAMRECGHSLAINAPPAAVLDAFFDAEALRAWWQVSRSVCTPRPLGSFALEWESTRSRDELLGRLGGALHGTVVEFVPGRRVFRRRSLLASARRRSDRSDGARSDVHARGRRHTAPGASIRIRQEKRTLGPVLRHHVERLGARARSVEEAFGSAVELSHTRWIFRKFDGPRARSGVMLTSTITEPWGIAPRSTSI